MNKFLISIILTTVLLSTGCTYFAPKKARIEAKVEERARELTSGAREANKYTLERLEKAQALLDTATLGSNTNVMELSSTNYFYTSSNLIGAQISASVTDDLLRRNENLIGKPIVDQNKAIEGLVSEDIKLRTKAEAKQTNKEEEEMRWIRKVVELERKLEAYGTKYEEDRNEKIAFYTKWGSILLAVIGIPIALLVLFPPLIGILTSLFPALSSFFGASKTVSNKLVRAVGDVRFQLKQQRDYEAQRSDIEPKTYTAEEMLSVVDGVFKQHLNNDSEQKVIETLRDRNNV